MVEESTRAMIKFFRFVLCNCFVLEETCGILPFSQGIFPSTSALLTTAGYKISVFFSLVLALPFYGDTHFPSSKRFHLEQQIFPFFISGKIDNFHFTMLERDGK